MLNSDDFTQMRTDLAAIRSDNEVSIVIRRGDTTLAAQTVRIAGQSTAGRELDSAGAQEARGRVVVLGPVGMDIQPGDRFTVAGDLYTVTLVRPNRTVATTVEAQIIQ